MGSSRCRRCEVVALGPFVARSSRPRKLSELIRSIWALMNEYQPESPPNAEFFSIYLSGPILVFGRREREGAWVAYLVIRASARVPLK